MEQHTETGETRLSRARRNLNDLAVVVGAVATSGACIATTVAALKAALGITTAIVLLSAAFLITIGLSAFVSFARVRSSVSPGYSRWRYPRLRRRVWLIAATLAVVDILTVSHIHAIAHSRQTKHFLVLLALDGPDSAYSLSESLLSSIRRTESSTPVRVQVLPSGLVRTASQDSFRAIAKATGASAILVGWYGRSNTLAQAYFRLDLQGEFAESRFSAPADSLESFAFQRQLDASLTSMLVLAVAELRYERHDLRGTIELLSQVIDTEGPNLPSATLAEIYLRRGFCFSQTKQFRSAVTDYNSAARLDTTWSFPLLNRAAALILLQQYDSAISALKTLGRRTPNVASIAYTNMAGLYERMGRQSAADSAAVLAYLHIHEYREGTVMNLVRLNMATVRLRRGRPDDAIRELALVDTTYLNPDLVLFERGVAFSMLGKFKEAIEEYSSISPDDSVFYWTGQREAAVILHHQGHSKSADSLLKLSVHRVTPELPDSLANFKEFPLSPEELLLPFTIVSLTPSSRFPRNLTPIEYRFDPN